MFIHPSSDVQSSNIGEGTYVWQFSVVLKGAVIGKNCNVNAHCFVENDVVVGDRVTLKSGVYLWDGTVVEDDVFIGPNATFVNNPYPRSKQYPGKHIGSILKKGCSIGANVTILSEITIGEYALIAAGSVVTENIPPYTLWIGNPARHRGYVTEEGETVGIDMVGKHDGLKYAYTNEKLIRLNA